MKRIVNSLFSIILILIGLDGFAQHAQINPVGSLFEIMPAAVKGSAVLGYESAALYPIGYKVNTNPAYYHRTPENLVQGFYQNLRTGTLKTFLALYDSASLEIINKRIDFQKAKAAFSSFEAIEYLSIFRFGNYYLVRFNLLGGERVLVPWVLTLKKLKSNRFVITETLPHDDAFDVLTSVHPWNLSREKLVVPHNIPAMLQIKFRHFADINDAESNQNDSLLLYIKARPIHSFAGKKTANNLVKRFFNTIRDSSLKSFAKFWVKKEQTEFDTSGYYGTQSNVQKAYYKTIDSLQVFGVIEFKDGLAVFYKSFAKGKRSALQVIPFSFEEGEYRLVSLLGTYSFWEMLCRKDVLEAVEAYFNQIELHEGRK